MNQLIFEPQSCFPQCHASCMLALSNGKLLCVYFAGTHEKHDDVSIWLSEFDGSRWKLPRKIAKVNNQPHWNPVLFQVSDGIRLVFKVGSEIRNWKSCTMISADDGQTWSSPFFYESKTACGPVRSKPIRLSDGTLLAPNSDENGPWLPSVDFSTDEGKSFRSLAAIPINQHLPERSDYLKGRGAIQPVLWETDTGRICALLRTSAGYIYRSQSDDRGSVWSCASPIHMPNNNSGIDAVRADDGRIFLACNPVSGDFAARTPLCVYVSEDNGFHFQLFAIVEDDSANTETGEPAEFSYPSLIINNDTLLMTYTWNRRSIAFWSHPIHNI